MFFGLVKEISLLQAITWHGIVGQKLVIVIEMDGVFGYVVQYVILYVVKLELSHLEFGKTLVNSRLCWKPCSALASMCKVGGV